MEKNGQVQWLSSQEWSAIETFFTRFNHYTFPSSFRYCYASNVIETKVDHITFTFLKSISIGNSFWFWCLQLSPSFGGRSTSKVQWNNKKCKLKTKITHVFSAISSLVQLKLSRSICFSMMVRRPTVATSAITQTPILQS